MSSSWSNALTWRCEVCRGERPDALIAVMTIKGEKRGVPFEVNLKYCRDRPGCADGVLDTRLARFASS